MPLRQTKYGGECPLGVFKIDIAGGCGSYTSDPLEGCLGNPEFGTPQCNYLDSDKITKDFDVNVHCMCPVDMTKSESRKLKHEFAKLIDDTDVVGTKENFWKYVNANRK